VAIFTLAPLWLRFTRSPERSKKRKLMARSSVLHRGSRRSRTRATRTDTIGHLSKQQFDLTHPQAFADQMTIDLPKQAAGIACRLGLDHDSLEH
jgi:hypothetical protein